MQLSLKEYKINLYTIYTNIIRLKNLQTPIPKFLQVIYFYHFKIERVRERDGGIEREHGEEKIIECS